MSSSSTTGYVSGSISTSALSAPTLSNTVNQGGFPKVILQLMEQGLMSADAQLKKLSEDLKYSENIYALKYILEHKGDSVSVDMLDTAVRVYVLKSLMKCFQEKLLLNWNGNYELL